LLPESPQTVVTVVADWEENAVKILVIDESQRMRRQVIEQTGKEKEGSWPLNYFESNLLPSW
jgi:hypothetical protein